VRVRTCRADACRPGACRRPWSGSSAASGSPPCPTSTGRRGRACPDRLAEGGAGADPGSRAELRLNVVILHVRRPRRAVRVRARAVVRVPDGRAGQGAGAVLRPAGLRGGAGARPRARAARVVQPVPRAAPVARRRRPPRATSAGRTRSWCAATAATCGWIPARTRCGSGAWTWSGRRAPLRRRWRAHRRLLLPVPGAGPDGRELDFPDSASYARYRAAAARSTAATGGARNVDRYVAELYDGVKREKPWVKVGISPIGTWRPNVAPQLGGFDAYEQIYADPQVADGGDARLPRAAALLADRPDRRELPRAARLVGEAEPARPRHVRRPDPGNVNVCGPRAGGWRPDEIIGQIYITRGRPGADGHVHFRMGASCPTARSRASPGRHAAAARVDSIREVQRRAQARRDTLADAAARRGLRAARAGAGDDVAG
jgi:hypothetical protein